MVSVCHINLARDPKLRGGERQTLILIQALVAQGLLQQRAVILRRGPLSDRLQGIPDLEVCRVSNRLSAALACRGAKLLHAHEAHAAQAACAASLFGPGYLVTRRVMKPVGSNPWSSAVYRNARVVAALTQAAENVVRRRFPGLPTVRIPAAWNPEPVEPALTREVRTRFAGKFIVGHIAAMDGYEKGHSVLLQAARLLCSELPDVQFLLLGGGRLEKEFRRQAGDLRNVYFSGWVENPVSWAGAFDLFVFPSLSEALGSTLLDVLRAGVPIVASRVDGVAEIVTGDCGVLVPPGDAEAVAQQVGRLYHSDALRRRLSGGGVALAEQYSPARMAKRYLEVYRSAGGIVV